MAAGAADASIFIILYYRYDSSTGNLIYLFFARKPLTHTFILKLLIGKHVCGTEENFGQGVLGVGEEPVK